jgi:outer membrane protein TolC
MASVLAAEPPAPAASEAGEPRSIEARLRDLEYPELRTRSAEEIEVYNALMSSSEATYKVVEAKHLAGHRGGSAFECARARQRAESAKGELAWAEGRVAEAYAHTCRALEFAEIEVKAAQAAYDYATVTLDTLLDAQAARAESHLRRIRAEKVAKVAGVDLTEVKRRQGEPRVAAGPEPRNARTIEARLRDLEYPELRKRSAEEIEVYKTLVQAREAVYKVVQAKYLAGHRGGSAFESARAGQQAESAKGKLAWAEGRVAEAYAHTCRAVQFAEKQVAAAQAAYDYGTVTVDTLLDAQTALAESQLRLLRAEKVAKVAGVDLTGVKRREAERRKAEKRRTQAEPPAQEGFFPPGPSPAIESLLRKPKS